MRRSSTSADCSPRTFVASHAWRYIAFHAPTYSSSVVGKALPAGFGARRARWPRTPRRIVWRRGSLASPADHAAATRSLGTEHANLSPRARRHPLVATTSERQRRGQRGSPPPRPGSASFEGREQLGHRRKSLVALGRRASQDDARATSPGRFAGSEGFGAAWPRIIRVGVSRLRRARAEQRLVQRDAEAELVRAGVDRRRAGTARATCTRACPASAPVFVSSRWQRSARPRRRLGRSRGASPLRGVARARSP